MKKHLHAQLVVVLAVWGNLSGCRDDESKMRNPAEKSPTSERKSDSLPDQEQARLKASTKATSTNKKDLSKRNEFPRTKESPKQPERLTFERLSPPDSYERPVGVFSTADFSRLWKSDWRKTLKQYGGKVIELKGAVVKVRHSFGQGGVVELGRTAGDEDIIRCHTLTRSPWLTVGVGQTVTMRGVLSQFAVGKSLIFCKIIQPDRPSAPVLKVEDMVKEYRADAAAFRRRHQSKFLLVKGEVVKVLGQSKIDSVYTIFDDGKLRVDLGTGRLRGDFKRGDKIAAYCRFDLTDFDTPNAINLLGIATREGVGEEVRESSVA